MELQYIQGVINRALNMGLLVRGKGGIEVNIGMVKNSPWFMIGDRGDFDCNFWHQFICLPGLGMEKPGSFIPTQCLNCWKVVVKPKTLKQLFTLKKAMLKMNYYSKCGIEKRITVGANYGAYTYCPSPEVGLKRKVEIRNMVDRELGKGIPVFLKRGCTEYEAFYGDSLNWGKVENQDLIERYILDTIKIVRVSEVQDKDIVARVHDNWVRHAYSVVDPTYTEYTRYLLPERGPLGVTYRKYDDMTADEIRSKVKGLDNGNNIYELAGNRAQ